MNTALILAAVTAIATALGGLLALKSKDRLHLVLGLSAGLLLGLVAFELLPEAFAHDAGEFLNVPVTAIALMGGFMALHLFEKFSGGHEPVESEYGNEHRHAGSVAGTLGALAMAGHVLIDGIALGVAFQVSNELGIAVFVAILVHAFSDGLNTVSLLIRSGNWTKRAIALLGVDAVARVSGAAIGSSIALNDDYIAIYLALFAGVLIYLATSHILPEAHSRHSSRWTLVTTIAGVLVMWGLVSQIHSSDIHAHDHSHSEDHSDHSDDDHSSDDHSDDDHSSEKHEDEKHEDGEDHDHSDE
jgi:ZIP family zinc transporter